MGKEIVAMILAGGRGTRLEALTAKVAKPLYILEESIEL
ncbi:sugar phosphate nucleotidyltransferase [Allocoprobacillus halotolerans]|uniref:Sugar phosphate nucleotidyltransferase n=1 Tax=Allocoprobacillus halotolerans TaxID=2944914 RepID=A0ABY5I1N5_9FIRM|nr:sugar phosphate nucleotidyltransferase [Allocoprobacillus halotolerans]UTY37907.1 sugar phosphate nucleotidyltransferase [Allocoprobacillus halotolerans]